MIGFQFGNLRTLNVTSRSLKKLLLRFLVNYANRVQVIVIDAPALESLDIEDWAEQDNVVRDLSSTIKAKLHLTNISFGSATCLFKHMGTSNLEFLHLSHSIILVSLCFAIANYCLYVLFFLILLSNNLQNLFLV